MSIVLSPNQRFAVVGKTRSGKTWFCMMLASLLVPADDPHWQVWWLDSKLDPKDAKSLKEWGFRKQGRRNDSSRIHIPLDPKNGPISWQAQVMSERALARRNVLIVKDEYKHVVQSTRRAGPGIQRVHIQGGGLNVGVIGQTQEPVDIPRQLISQAAHIFLFDLTYPADIKYARSLHPGYDRPRHPHGFYHAYIDGDANWRYYAHMKAWYDSIVREEQLA